MKYLLPLCFLFMTMISCTSSQKEGEYSEDGFDAFSVDTLNNDIRILASDSFLGRKPFTEGEVKTIAYLQKRFAESGLEPGNGYSYLQDVPMVSIATQADPEMQVETPGGNFILKGFEDYVIWTEKTDPLISLDKNELVFAGYGVNAPERNWNDYEGLDVKGKIVMVMVNDPGYGSDGDLFKGDTMTYYGRWRYKFEEAARQGAKGCLVIHNTKAASYPFTVVQNNWNGSRLLLDEKDKDVSYCDVVGWVTGPTAIKLLEAAGYDSTIYAEAAKPGFKAVSLNETLSTKMRVTSTYNNSQNVIGKITGSKYPDEYIIYTAHWDHLGIGKPDETGDSIYNGALDNASGTAGLFQLAKAFNSLEKKPERTIVFLAVTAEEQGLKGSAYYAQNPIYPTSKTLANINMDILNSIGKTKDVIVVGQGQSDLEDYLHDAAQKMGREIAYEQHPEAGFYYRSDHFNFAKVGIPALYINSGIDVIGKGKDYGKQKLEEYNTKNYHRPSDEYKTDWDMDGGMEDLKLMFLVGKRIALEEKWPEWKDGSEFKGIRK